MLAETEKAPSAILHADFPTPSARADSAGTSGDPARGASPLSRRQACLLLAGAPLLASGFVRALAASGVGVGAGAIGAAGGLGTGVALAEEGTAAALASAQEQYAQVQAQIDDLAAQQQQLSIDLDATLSAMETKRGEIDQTTADVEATQAELQRCQDELAGYVENGYKYGDATTIDMLLSSKTFEELVTNVFYLTKINDAEVELIDHTREVKRQLEEQQATLEAEYAELDGLREQQEGQLADMEARQNDAYVLLNSLDAEVQALVEQYNQELIAQAQAANAAGSSGGGEGGSGGESYGGGSYGGGSVSGSGSASAVVNACYSTPSPGAGYCAAWVTNVFLNAGIGGFYGDACDMYASWCYSSDRGSLQPGMIVAVSSHSHTSAGQVYGHIGIYVGGGVLMDNIGSIRSIDVDSWISYYGDTVTPRWGWLGGVALG